MNPHAHRAQTALIAYGIPPDYYEPGQHAHKLCPTSPCRRGGAEDMVERLLRMEGEGDPYSIINVYLEERRQEQQRQSVQHALGVGSALPACGAAAQHGQHRQHWQQGQQVKPAPSGEAAPLAVAQADDDRPISAASNQENVSANVGSPGPRQAGLAACTLGESAQQHAQPLALAGVAPNALQAGRALFISAVVDSVQSWQPALG